MYGSTLRTMSIKYLSRGTSLIRALPQNAHRRVHTRFVELQNPHDATWGDDTNGFFAWLGGVSTVVNVTAGVMPWWSTEPR